MSEMASLVKCEECGRGIGFEENFWVCFDGKIRCNSCFREKYGGRTAG